MSQIPSEARCLDSTSTRLTNLMKKENYPNLPFKEKILPITAYVLGIGHEPSLLKIVT
jgi:hypothetical protein